MFATVHTHEYSLCHLKSIHLKLSLGEIQPKINRACIHSFIKSFSHSFIHSFSVCIQMRVRRKKMCRVIQPEFMWFWCHDSNSQHITMISALFVCLYGEHRFKMHCLFVFVFLEFSNCRVICYRKICKQQLNNMNSYPIPMADLCKLRLLSVCSAEKKMCDQRVLCFVEYF